MIIRMEPEKSSMRECDDCVRRPWRSVAGVTQAEAGNAGRDIEALLALDTDRLEGDRLLEAADQHIGTKPYSDRGFGRGAAIGAGKRPAVDLAGSEDRPGHIGFRGNADVDAN